EGLHRTLDLLPHPGETGGLCLDLEFGMCGVLAVEHLVEQMVERLLHAGADRRARCGAGGQPRGKVAGPRGSVERARGGLRDAIGALQVTQNPLAQLATLVLEKRARGGAVDRREVRGTLLEALTGEQVVKDDERAEVLLRLQAQE